MPALLRSAPGRPVARVAAALAVAVVAAPSAAATGGSWTRTTGGAGVVDPGIAQVGSGLRSVVVSGVAGAGSLVRRAVESVGGTATRELPIVDGVAATVPADRVADLADLAGVSAVTLDRKVRLSGANWDDSTSASAYPWTAGAAQTWPTTGRGSGQISVAVLDTGVSAVGRSP